jgi:hypothetical protein
MEKQTLSETLEAMRKGQCIAILDSRKVEIDLFFPTISLFPLFLKTLKIEA